MSVRRKTVLAQIVLAIPLLGISIASGQPAQHQPIITPEVPMELSRMLDPPPYDFVGGEQPPLDWKKAGDFHETGAAFLGHAKKAGLLSRGFDTTFLHPLNTHIQTLLKRAIPGTAALFFGDRGVMLAAEEQLNANEKKIYHTGKTTWLLFAQNEKGERTLQHESRTNDAFMTPIAHARRGRGSVDWRMSLTETGPDIVQTVKHRWLHSYPNFDMPHMSTHIDVLKSKRFHQDNRSNRLSEKASPKALIAVDNITAVYAGHVARETAFSPKLQLQEIRVQKEFCPENFHYKRSGRTGRFLRQMPH